MSASERLRHWTPPGDRIIPVFRKTGPKLAGFDAFTRAEDLEALRNALPLIADVVEAAERVAHEDGPVWGTSDGSGFKLEDALTALREALNDS